MSQVTQNIRQTLRDQADQAKADFLPRFFKSEPGDTDQFLGVTVPKQRVITKEFYNQILPQQVPELLHSLVHEERLTALLIWVLQYQKGDPDTKKQIYQLYLNNTKWINNWDLVDSSASYIVGDYIWGKDQSIIQTLSESPNVWERRIAILAAGEFIRRGEFAWTLKLAKQNLKDQHHYIHKATGWMLREVGKRDRQVLVDFLNQYAARMPRTMLRYAIEHFDLEDRRVYLNQR